MNITLRISARADAKVAILRDADLARIVDPTGMVFEITADSPLLDRLLDITRNTSGCWFNPYMTFTPAELSQARYLQADCRGKIVLESKRDYEKNRARLDALDFRHVDGNRLSIKIIDRLTFSKVNLAANAIGCASDWMAEFIVGAAVASAFRTLSLTGCELRPIYRATTGEALPGVFHLYSDSIMPPAQLDATTPAVRDETNGWRELGCLSYSLSERLADFNRTAENFSNNSIPVWIVSAHVRVCLQDHKIKGWAFRPVLEVGSPLHDTYTRIWADLLAKIAVNPRNHF